MSKHADGCEFVGKSFSLYLNNPVGDDESLSINEDGIFYNPKVYSHNEPDVYIRFNYCPCCGCSLTD